jgi:WD40 repeat protein
MHEIMLNPLRWLVLLGMLIAIALTGVDGQVGDLKQLVQRESEEVEKTPAGKLTAPGLFTRIRQLVSQGASSGDVGKAASYYQQARWLTPDPQLRPPAHVSRVLGTLKFKHDHYPTAVVYAPDGRTLFTASRDGTLRHWDLTNGRMLHHWDLGHPLSYLAVSPDGKWVAVAEGYRQAPSLDLSTFSAREDHPIHLFDLATMTKRHQLKGHGKNPIRCLAFSPDSRTLASGGPYTGSGQGDTLRFWDVSTGQEAAPSKDGDKITSPVVNLVWSKDASKLFITSDNKSFAVFNCQTKLIDQSIREIGMIYALALSPDGETLAISGEFVESSSCAIHLYSTREWKITGKLTGHSAAILGLAFHPSGKQLVSVSAKPEAMVKVWDVAQKTAIAQYQGHGGDILGLALRRDGEQIATVSMDQSIRLWQASMMKPPRTLVSGTAPVWCVLLGAQDQRLITAGADQTAAEWDVSSGKSLQKYTEHRSPVTAAAYRPDFGEVATGGGDQVIRLWNPTNGQTHQTLKGHTGVITSLAYSPDGKWLYSASADRTVKAWNLAEKKAMYSLDQHRSVVTSVAVNLDGSLLATGGADSTIRIWNASDGKEVRTLLGHNGAVTGLTFSPGGQLLASVGADGVSKIWDPATRTDALRTLTGHSGQLMAVAFSPNHKYLATAGADEVIRIWNLANGQELRAMKGHDDWVTSIAYLSDGESLVSGSVDGTVRLWQESRTAEYPTYGHQQAVRYLAVSPQGDRVASAGDDGLILLWDTATGQDVATLRGHLTSVHALAFSSDGKWLASGDQEKVLKLWDVAAARELASVQTTGSALMSMTFLAEDRGLAALLGGADIGLWKVDLEKRALVEPFPNERNKNKFLAIDSAPRAISFARNRLALGSYDGSARICDIKAFAPEQGPRIECYNNAVEELCLSADGARLVTVNSDSQFKLWEVEPKRLVKMWGGRNSKVVAMALHPQGTEVLSCHESNEVVLADGQTGQEKRSWKFRGPVRYVVFSPSARQAWVAAENGVVYQLELP